MQFIDFVRIYCEAGRGGDGIISWRREKYVPKGGPAGGDGGKGGSIYVEGDRQRWTLHHLRYTKFVKAEGGKPGGRMCKTGASGKDIILPVPLGTVVKDEKTGEVLGEILEHGQRLLIAKGGRGGRGNYYFRSSTNQAPEYAEKGKAGEKRVIILELKVLADVGLIGFPNAGKSTLLSVLTAAKPKIADYPFTTLVPNLGVVELSHYRSFTIADIPGIIEGAHQGKGLGLRFLRHIERNAILLFLIPVTSENIIAEYQILLNELRQYEASLLQKPRILAISKADLIGEEERKKLLNQVRQELVDPIPILLISSVTHYNLNLLKELLWELVAREKLIISF